MSEQLAGKATVLITAREHGATQTAATTADKVNAKLREAAQKAAAEARATAQRLEQDLFALRSRFATNETRRNADATRTALVRRQQIMMQAGFGLEDAASQFTTTGFAGAIRAASNNVSMMALALGGANMAMAAIGVTAAVQVVPAIVSAFDRSEERAKQFQRRLESLRESMSRGLELQVRTVGWARDLAGVENLRTADAARERGMQAGNSLEDLQARRDALRENIRRVQQAYRAEAGEEANFRGTAAGMGDAFARQGVWGAAGQAMFGGELQAGKDFNEKMAALAAEMEKLEASVREVDAAIEQEQRVRDAAVGRAKELQRIEDTRARALRAITEREAAARVAALQTPQAAEAHATTVRLEMDRIDADFRALGDTRHGAMSAEAKGDLDREMATLTQRWNTLNAELLATEQRLPVLQAKDTRKQQREARDLAINALQESDNPELVRRRADLELSAARDRYAEMNLPATLASRMLGVQELQGRAAVARAQLAEATRAGPSVPQVGLSHGSIEAAQRAAENRGSRAEQQMLGELEQIRRAMEDQLRLLADAAGEFQAVR